MGEKETIMNNEEWRHNFNESSEENPAENSCVNCIHELTCGYSPLAPNSIGKRTRFSYCPCVLGDMSGGTPFFSKKGAE
jgi:hypothetical protein